MRAVLISAVVLTLVWVVLNTPEKKKKKCGCGCMDVIIEKDQPKVIDRTIEVAPSFFENDMPIIMPTDIFNTFSMADTNGSPEYIDFVNIPAE